MRCSYPSNAVDKVCPERWESPRSKDFPRRGGLYAEVASRRTQIALRS